MAQKKEYRDLILSNTIRIEEVQDNFIKPFNRLAESIREGKAKLNINTVDFIVLKILNKNGNVYRFERKHTFDVYVFGTFRKHFNPTYKVAEAFAEFYLEMGILPNIIPVPKHILMKNPKEFVNKIRNGVLIYERG